MTTMQCVSCGMPMSSPEDHAIRDTSKVYCRHCARPDGSMVSRDEARTRLAVFMVKTQGIDATAAGEAVDQMMERLPAWKRG